MASPAAGRDVPNAPARDESERAEPNHPEPACQEAQKWIEVSDRPGGLGGLLLHTAGTERDHTVTYWDINTYTAPVRRHLLLGRCSVGLLCGTIAVLHAWTTVCVKSFRTCVALTEIEHPGQL